ncbi:uncharacterized [Tachysurus ichikawai]
MSQSDPHTRLIDNPQKSTAGPRECTSPKYTASCVYCRCTNHSPESRFPSSCMFIDAADVQRSKLRAPSAGDSG